LIDHLYIFLNWNKTVFLQSAGTVFGCVKNAAQWLLIALLQIVVTGKSERRGTAKVGGDKFAAMAAGQGLVKMANRGGNRDLWRFQRGVGGMGKQAGVAEFVLELCVLQIQMLVSGHHCSPQ